MLHLSLNRFDVAIFSSVIVFLLSLNFVGHSMTNSERNSEKSVVTAVRDIQWILAIKKILEASGDVPLKDLVLSEFLPTRFLDLVGDAESNAGDFSVKQGARFFIFEAKSLEAAISEEWSGGEKELLKKLKTIKDCDDANLIRSLRGHFFSYWKNDARKKFGQIVIPGEIYAEPYYLAAKRKQGGDDYIGDLPYVFGVKSNAENQRGESFVAIGKKDKDNIIQLFDGNCVIGSLDTQGAFERDGLHEAGLELEELKAYVQFLSGSTSGGDPIRAILLSSDAKFYRVISNTNELGELLSDLDLIKYEKNRKLKI